MKLSDCTTLNELKSFRESVSYYYVENGRIHSVIDDSVFF